MQEVLLHSARHASSFSRRFRDSEKGGAIYRTLFCGMPGVDSWSV